MSTLNFTCNFTQKDIKPGQSIVLFPISQEFIIEHSRCEEGADNRLILPKERRFHSISPFIFEPFLIRGTVEHYPKVKLEDCQKEYVWKLMTTFHKLAIPSEDDDNLTHQLRQNLKNSKDFALHCNIDQAPHYTWIAMMTVALELSQNEGVDTIRSNCQEQLLYYFIDNLYFGIPFRGQGMVPVCVMKLASFSQDVIQKMASMPVNLPEKFKLNIQTMEQFQEFVIQRYCSTDEDNKNETLDKDIQAIKLTKIFMRLHKVLFRPIQVCFAEEIFSDIVLEVQEAIKNSNDPQQTFKALSNHLCTISYMYFFGIRPVPMEISDVDDTTDPISNNYLQLIKHFTD